MNITFFLIIFSLPLFSVETNYIESPSNPDLRIAHVLSVFSDLCRACYTADEAAMLPALWASINMFCKQAQLPNRSYMVPTIKSQCADFHPRSQGLFQTLLRYLGDSTFHSYPNVRLDPEGALEGKTLRFIQFFSEAAENKHQIAESVSGFAELRAFYINGLESEARYKTRVASEKAKVKDMCDIPFLQRAQEEAFEPTVEIVLPLGPVSQAADMFPHYKEKKDAPKRAKRRNHGFKYAEIVTEGEILASPGYTTVSVNIHN